MDARPLTEKLRKLPSRYIQDNFFITVSGVHWIPALQCARLSLGADRILFAADYPMESSRDAVRFVEEAPIPDEEKEKIFHANAEKLLGL
jgi:2,3-dihydroxybenzoate decarboxylase